MSKLSIYENNWIDLVFENKNKEYGAYQLRHDNAKNSYTALFIGLLFVASVISILYFTNKLKTPLPTNTTENVTIDETIHVTKVKLNQNELPLPALPAIKESAPVTTIIKKEQLVSPVIVKSDLAIPDIAQNTENVITSSQNTHGTGINTGNIASSGTGNGTETTGKTGSGTNVINPGALDVMPAFPGGIEKFYNYVGTKFRQPDLESGQIFKVYVSFVIEKDGSMTDIKILKDPGFGLGKEAIRVLQSLKTKWSPGIVNSKPVRTAYNLPIVIKAQ